MSWSKDFCDSLAHGLINRSDIDTIYSNNGVKECYFYNIPLTYRNTTFNCCHSSSADINVINIYVIILTIIACLCHII